MIGRIQKMMRYVNIILLCGYIQISATGQGCNKDSAMSFVSKLFHGGRYVSHGSTSFRGYSTEFTLIEVPLLNKLLPDYCFFSTFFYSSEFEYSNVETVVALMKSNSKKSKITHSPVYADTPNDFINLFLGIRTKDTAERIKLAEEITSIFTSITYKGHLSRLINFRNENVVSFELWHDDLRWRIYKFYFDRDNKLKQVKIDNGVGRDK